MTAASTGSTAAGPTGAGPRPQLLTLAAILLGVSAVLGLLFPISQLTDSQFFGCSIAVASANATPTTSSSATPSPSPSSTATTAAQQQAQFKDCVDGRGEISAATGDEVSGNSGRLLLQGVIPFVLLGGMAFFAFRGVPLVRWFVVGAWVLGGIIGIVPLGPLQAFGVIQQGYPTVTILLVVLGSITFTAAAVIVNLPPVTRYLNAKRPIRAAAARGGASGRPAGGGGLLAGFFGPRPPRGGAGAGGTSSTVSMAKKPAGGTTPASTRPPKSKTSGSGSSGGSGGSGNTGRAKGKKRG